MKRRATPVRVATIPLHDRAIPVSAGTAGMKDSHDYMRGRRDAMNAAREALSGRADTIEGPTPTLRRKTAALQAWRVAMQGLSLTVKVRRPAVARRSAIMFEKSPNL